jgi:hypothetical protein
MARLALLAVLLSACLAAAPAAQAAELPLDLQSSAAAAVGQAQAVVETVTTAAPAAPPQVSSNTSAPALHAAAEAAEPVAQPAVKRAEYTTAAAVPVIVDGPRQTSSNTPGHAARFKQGGGQAGSGAAPTGQRAAPSRHPAHTTAPSPAVDRAPHASGTAAKQRPPAPEPAPPASAGGAASAPAAALSFGGLALLAAVICLAGPRLRRRLLIEPAALRPAAFVALLERPG